MIYAILNDTHIGLRNSNDRLATATRDFFTNCFFPYCDKHSIKDIIHAGDWFDNRVHTTVKAKTLSRWIISEMRKRGMTMHFIVGNHDVLYKNTNDPSAAVEILSKESDVVRIYSEPTVIDSRILLVPWINKTNGESFLKSIREASVPYVVGHFAIDGFQMIGNSNSKCSGGMHKKLFGNYDKVLSGHFHVKSVNKNIYYLGSQIQMDWSDCGVSKFFHTFNSENGELVPIKNSADLFWRIPYQEGLTKIEDFGEELTNAFVIFVVSEEIKNEILFEEFLQQFQDKFKPYFLDVRQTLTSLGAEFDTTESLETASMSNQEIIEEYIRKRYENREDICIKDLNKMAQDIYVEALNTSNDYI